MATVMDTLETVMTLKGADSVVSGFTNLASKLLGASAAGDTLAAAQTNLAASQAALLAPLTVMLAETTQLTANLFGSVAGFGALAASEGVATATTAVLGAGLALLEAPLVIITVLLGTLTAGAILAGKALSEFSNSEDTIGRLAIRMKNLGNVFPTQELVKFSGALGQQLGIDDELIAKLGAMAAGFGLTRKQVEKAIPVVLDVAVANKVDPNEVLEKIFRAAHGRPQGLIALNIDPAKIKGDVHDVNNLLNQIGAGFAGTAAAFRDTLPGTFQAFGVSAGNLLESLGRFFSPAILGLINHAIHQMDALTALLTRMADFLHIPTAANIGGGNASKIGFKGDPEQTAYQREIAENTKGLDAIVKTVLGGPGTLAKQAFTFRDSQMALKI